MLAHDGPNVGAENDERQAAAGQVLLIFDVLVRCDHHVEAGRFGRVQQFAVFELRVPLHVGEGAGRMPGKQTADADGHVLIKQDAQVDGFART